ncbi:MAG TPA: hypothetical protein VN622_11060 [Clostridia bacterium]|nr:hypothetical protein [Clostridia bacterium]
MRTISEVVKWCAGALVEHGDPAVPVCQLFFRWVETPAAYRGDELVCGVMDGQFGIWLCPGEAIAMPIVEGAAEFGMLNAIDNFGATKIANGVWSLSPSLNLPDLIHGFVVLYDVPDPAPWERRIILLSEELIA